MAKIGFSNAADFVCDDSNAQQQIELAMKTNSVLEFESGRYVLRGDKPIMIRSGKPYKFIGSGVGQTIFCPAGDFGLHTMFTSYNQIVDGLLFRKISFDLSTCPDVGALQIYQGNYVEVDNCEFYGQRAEDPSIIQWTLHFGAYREGEASSLASFGLNIHDCYFHDNNSGNAEVLLVANHHYGRVVNNRFDSNRAIVPETVFYLDNSDMRVVNNTSTNTGMVPLAMSHSRDIYLERNQWSPKNYSAVFIINCEGVDLNYNKLIGEDKNSVAAIEFWDRIKGPDNFVNSTLYPISNSLKFIGNEFRRWKYGIEAQRTDIVMAQNNILIADNDFRDISDNAVYLGVDQASNKLRGINILNNRIHSWQGSHTGAIICRGYAQAPMTGININGNTVAPSTQDHTSAIRLINTRADSVTNNNVKGTGRWYDAISLVNSSINRSNGNLV